MDATFEPERTDDPQFCTPSRPGQLTLDDQLCFALYSAANAITRAYRPLLSEFGITYSQYLLLLALWQHGASSVREVAEHLRLGANAITPLVDQLEAAGLVTRTRGTIDRRVVTVAVTPQGDLLRARAAETQYRVLCRTGLSDEALARIRADLWALTERIAAALPPGRL